jgi:hypothetical protein
MATPTDPRLLAQLAGLDHGPDAPLLARDAALPAAEAARVLVLVEGISDRLAVETLAARLGRDLGGEGVAILPIGGSGEAGKVLARFARPDRRILGLLDADAEAIFGRAMARAGIGGAADDLAPRGFFTCQPTLEGELIRALGPEGFLALVERQGDMSPLRTLQRQVAWAQKPLEAQLNRFLRAKARRSMLYARLMVQACPLDGMPQPLMRLLAAI